MLILGIETSCDETSVAIVKDGTKIISNIISSSQSLHQKTGGIIPEIAAREQIKCIIPVLKEAIKPLAVKEKGSNAQTLSKSIIYIDAIAVTVGPGLIGSLLVGVETAKTLALLSNKPIIPVNHIFAHIYANWFTGNIPGFPAIALVVSGGHTELFYLESHEKIKWLGGTLDDAAGECFDKTARLLGLGYPGGPAIAVAAEEFRVQNLELRIKEKFQLPRPMINSKDYNFSFSGLKTAVLREVNRLKTIQQYNNITIKQLSHEIQESITDVLVNKTLAATQKYNVKSLLIGGGVAANKRLTEKFKFQISNFKLNISLFIPPPSLCTDNAAYIAGFAYFHNHPVPWQDTRARPDLEVEV